MTTTYYSVTRKRYLNFLGFLTNITAPFISIWLLSRIVRYSVHAVFSLTRFYSWCSGKPLPPRYNTPFVTPAQGIEAKKLWWFTETEDRQRNDPVILYLHGGGYGLSLVPQSLISLRDIYWGVGNSRLSILLVDYTTTVQAKYPTQLKEAAGAFNALTETCDNIILFGDSAGGHLALQLMRLFKLPIEGIPQVTKRAAAYIGMSPCVNFAIADDEETRKRSWHDIMTVSAIHQWGEMYASDGLQHQPEIRLETEGVLDWNTVLPEPHKILITLGDHEVLAPSILHFIKMNDLVAKGANICHKPDDVHDSLMIFGVSPMLDPTVDFLKRITF